MIPIGPRGATRLKFTTSPKQQQLNTLQYSIGYKFVIPSGVGRRPAVRATAAVEPWDAWAIRSRPPAEGPRRAGPPAQGPAEWGSEGPWGWSMGLARVYTYMHICIKIIYVYAYIYIYTYIRFQIVVGSSSKLNSA